MSKHASIDKRAAELAESWINGNRDDVAQALESAGVDGAALAFALAWTLGGKARSVTNLQDVAAYMRRRAEQRANDADNR
jgi:hypothetical protein